MRDTLSDMSHAQLPPSAQLTPVDVAPYHPCAQAHFVVALCTLATIGILVLQGCVELQNPRCGCESDAECDDGRFCNGPETCQDARCVVGTPPCEEACDEEGDACSPCTDAVLCDDGNLCTIDRCDNNVCTNEPLVCDDGVACTNDVCDGATGHCTFLDICSAGMECDAGSGACIDAPECETDDDCVDDDVFCNGLPFCNSVTGTCVTRNNNTACFPIGPCDEEADRCVESFDSELCVRQCVDAQPICSPEDVPARVRCFDAAVEEVTNLASTQEGNDYFTAISGRCNDNGPNFVAFTTGNVAIAGFYAAKTGSFVAQRTRSDEITSPCLGKTYWPAIVECDLGTVDAVIAGAEWWSIGDRVDLRTIARIDDGETD